MSEESRKAVGQPGVGQAAAVQPEAAGRPEVQAALVALDATASAPLAERAEAFEVFHASLTQILDAEPAQ